MIGRFMKKFSSVVNDKQKKPTTILNSMKELSPLLATFGALIIYMDNKFSSINDKFSSIEKNFNDKFYLLDKAFTDSRIQSARTEEECKAYVGQVKIYSEQVIRAEAKSDLRRWWF
jgi:hypothetical protein